MKFGDKLQLGVVFLSVVATIDGLTVEKVNKRQVGADKGVVLDTTEDRAAEATGFLGAGAVQAHAKYFQDFITLQLSPHTLEFGHVCENPDEWEQRYERKDLKNHRDQGRDHYEVGHRRGNDHHFIERHEKAHPHAGDFKTKVRWGDKHGGYGEHFWDYNHAGHGDAHDEGTEQVSDYQNYEDSQSRKKRQPDNKGMSLVLDQATGRIVDQLTGRAYMLQPVNRT